jgi:hypothetical protein
VVGAVDPPRERPVLLEFPEPVVLPELEDLELAALLVLEPCLVVEPEVAGAAAYELAGGVEEVVT